MGNDSPDLEKQRASMEHLGEQAWAALAAGDFAQAESMYEAAIALARAVSDRAAEAIFLSYLGVTRHSMGKPESALADLAQAVNLAREYGLSKVEAQACMFMAEQELDAGHAEQAIHGFLKSLEAAYNAKDPLGMEISFWNLGRLYLERGWAEQASE
ncbi:MAG: tetratricopeptide repeat protein, partial [Terriglobales bacterium]